MISVVIPAFNEADNIRETLRETVAALAAGGVESWEILVVDDHSSDSTYEVVSEEGSGRVRCLRLSRRSGSHVALRAGLAHARGAAVAFISADGQDDPRALARMIERWRAGDQVVWALRRERDEPLAQKALAAVFYRLIHLLAPSPNREIDRSRADFCLLDRQAVDAINSCPERNTSIFGLIEWVGFRQGAIEYERRRRRTGASKWNLRSRFDLAGDWIFALSGLPLRWMAVLGGFIAALGLLAACVVLALAAFGRDLPAAAVLVVVLLVLSGLQMTMLGVLGEYLRRSHVETRRRPLYFIERRSDEGRAASAGRQREP